MVGMPARRPADPTEDLERPTVLDWDRFARMFARAHKRGEHVAIVGPTGGGKSTVAIELACLIGNRTDRDRRPSRVVAIGTKRRDRTLEQLIKRGWPVIKEWPPAYGQEHCIVWVRNVPKSKRPAVHHRVYTSLFDRIDDEGNQTIVVDEEAYLERPLPNGAGMAPTLEGFWSESRSNGVTLIAATQRPRNVTRLMWSEPSWVIVLKPEDEDDAKRVAELTGRKLETLAIIDQLGAFEFLCIRRQRGGGRGLYVSRVDP